MSTPTDPYNSAQRHPRQDNDQLLDPIEETEEDGLHFSADEQQEAPLDSRVDDDPGEPTQAWSADELTADDAAEPTTTEPATGEIPDPGEVLLHNDGQETGTVTRTSVLGVDEDRAADTASGTAQADTVGPTSETGVTRTPTGSIPSQSDSSAAPTAVAAGTAAAGAGAGGFTAAGDNRENWAADPGEVRDIPDEPRKRTGHHILSFFLILLLLPVAWYLISDAGARLFLVENNPWESGNINIPAILELVGGLAVIAVMWMITRASTFGAQFWGTLVTVGGLVALAMPNLGKRTVSALDSAIGSYNDFTGNVVHHFNLDLGTGRIATFGFIVLMTGIACHLARRDGVRNGTAIGRRNELLKETNAR